MRKLGIAVALGVTFGTAGLAFAQPAYGPNAAYYYPYYAPPPGYYYPYSYDATHSSGGASRSDSYWGGQKSN